MPEYASVLPSINLGISRFTFPVKKYKIELKSKIRDKAEIMVTIRVKIKGRRLALHL
jgi:hypothetical protein